MTAPRQVLTGTTYLFTRRCTQRQFLLTPSPTTNAVFRYVLAVAAARFGITVHAFCVLSNHVHLIVTDTRAQLPAFAQMLHGFVARAVNASLGHSESFWAPGSYSAVALVTPDDIVDKTAYVLANPVAAGLVRHGRDWPGLWSDPALIGAGAISIERPATFFRTLGRLPATTALELSAPSGFASSEEFRDRVMEALASREETIGSAGRTFLGVKRVLRQRWWNRATTTEARRTLRPLVAARDKLKRIEALCRIADFLSAYRVARAAWIGGERGVVFPAGTYWLRVVDGVCCAAPG